MFIFLYENRILMQIWSKCFLKNPSDNKPVSVQKMVEGDSMSANFNELWNIMIKPMCMGSVTLIFTRWVATCDCRVRSEFNVTEWRSMSKNPFKMYDWSLCQWSNPESYRSIGSSRLHNIYKCSKFILHLSTYLGYYTLGSSFTND